MKRFHFAATVLLMTASAVLISGCGGGDETDKPKPRTERKGGTSGEKKASSGGQKTGSSGPLTALDTKGTATAKGKATFDGTPPKAGDFRDRMKAHGDARFCLAGKDKEDFMDPTWIVGPNKEVRNVVVWLRPPKGKVFKIPPDLQKQTQPVILDQPYCAFHPHVMTLFPSFYDFDSKAQKPTGQKFLVKNSAEMGHNTAWSGNSIFNAGTNYKIAPKTEIDIPAKPCDSKKSGEDLIKINCDLHKWMSAFAWAFDHPYAAVTKEDGTYEIKNAPAGAEVELMYWHESMSAPKVLESITLKEGETATKDIKITK
jgi:hypothetical protein